MWVRHFWDDADQDLESDKMYELNGWGISAVFREGICFFHTHRM